MKKPHHNPLLIFCFVFALLHPAVYAKPQQIEQQQAENKKQNNCPKYKKHNGWMSKTGQWVRKQFGK